MNRRRFHKKAVSVIFVVGDYGYGSLGMALSVAEELSSTARLAALANGDVISILRRSLLFDDVYDVTHSTDLRDLTLPGKPFVVVDFHSDDLNVWDVVKSGGIPFIHLNMHAWRLRGAPEVGKTVPHADALYERYPTIDRDAHRLGISGHALIAPVVGRVEDRVAARRDLIVANLGGGIYPRNENRDAGLRILGHLLCQLESSLPGKLLVCCGHAASPVIKQLFPGLDVQSVRRRDFLSLVGSASLVLSQPSVHSPYEAMLRDRPVVLLPPQNFSQFFHFIHWCQAGLIPSTYGIANLLQDINLDPFLEEFPQEELVGVELARVGRSGSCLASLENGLREAITEALARRQDVLDRQHEVCGQLGGQEGAAELARRILDVAAR